MIPRSIVIFLFILSSFLNLSAQANMNLLTAEIQDEMIIIRVNSITFTCYRFGDGQKYPYFYPVNGPSSGISVTTESSLPYPHHRSLWFGCDKVNGGNYWQEGNERGQIISKNIEIVKTDTTLIHIKNECIWKQPHEAPIISELRDIRISAPTDEIRIVDFEITLTALTDITIKKTNHSLFSARMDPALSVKEGGTLINAEGNSGEKSTAGFESVWCDYYGSRNGIVEGLAIYDSPNNPWYPSKWFTRDYGFFSPTNLNWISNEITFLLGESIKLEYRAVVHSGTTEEADIGQLYEQWVNTTNKNNLEF